MPKLGEVSHKIFDLRLQHISSRITKPFLFEGVTANFCCRHVSGGSCKIFPFRKGRSIRIGGSPAQEARLGFSNLSKFHICRKARTKCSFPHYIFHALDFIFYTLHFRFYTPHLTLETPHPIFRTWPSTLHTPQATSHPPLRTLHSTPCTPHLTLLTLHSALYTHTLHSALHTLNCKLEFHTLYSTLYILNSTPYSPHFTLGTPHSQTPTLHFTLHTTLYN